jgi:hypothetical protein
MRFILLLTLIFLLSTASGQEKVAPSEAFTVSGAVEKELTFRTTDIAAFPATSLPDVPITNHLGEPRGIAKGLKGVRVKDVLANLVIKAESPKVLSEFYLTFVATDGYTVVYSWNELFNSPTGENCYFITEKEGKPLAEMTERILVLTPTDFKTGRRHVKGLNRIVVARAGKD